MFISLPLYLLTFHKCIRPNDPVVLVRLIEYLVGQLNFGSYRPEAYLKPMLAFEPSKLEMW
jgi:hypothetical protein